jgi:hypothetical protein
MAKRKAERPPPEPEPDEPHLQHWQAPLPQPIKLRDESELLTLLDAGRLIAERLPPSLKSAAVEGTAHALMEAAATGEAEDIDYAVTLLRLLLQAANLTHDPDRARYKTTKWHKRKPARRR